MCCNSTPDTSGINKAAEANADVARQALTWYEGQFAEQAPLRQQAIDTAKTVSDAQLDAMRHATWLSRDDWRYQNETYRPLEKGIVANAESYDTQERRDQAAGQAVGDVQQQAGAQRAVAGRELARLGVNPADGSFAAMERAADTSTTLGAAQAANRAREQVRTVGQALKMDAASLGRNLPSQQATQASLALNAGNSGVSNAVAPVNIASQGTQLVGNGFQTAIQGNNSSGNLYGTAGQIQNAANSANNSIWGGLGTAVGGYAGSTSGSAAITSLLGISDENAKEDRKPVNDEKVLDAVSKTPVETWKYKDGKGDGDAHVGPMAQSVADNMGQRVAPGGKMIDLISANGINLSAIRALNKKVDRIAAKAGISQ